MYGTDDPKEKGHGGNRDLVNDSAARAGVLLSGNNVPDTRDFVNPPRIATLDGSAMALLDTAYLAPPVLDSETAPAAPQGHSTTLLAAIGHLATDKPQRPAMTPVADSAMTPVAEYGTVEYWQARAEKAEKALKDIKGYCENGKDEGYNTADVVFAVWVHAHNATKKSDKPSKYFRGAKGFYEASRIGMGYRANLNVIKKFAGEGLVVFQSESVPLDKHGKPTTPDKADSWTTESFLQLPDLPSQLPPLVQTDDQAKAAAVKNEQREKAKRDAARVAELEAMLCPHCGEKGLKAVCNTCGCIVTPDDVMAVAEYAMTPEVTIERPRRVTLPPPVADSAITPPAAPVADMDTQLNMNAQNDNGPTITPIRESVSPDGPSLAVTADDILLVAKASTHIASRLVETVGFNVNTRTKLRKSILKITDAPPISNDEAVGIVIELAQRGRYDLAVMVGNAYKLPSATRKELLGQYIDIGSNAA